MEEFWPSRISAPTGTGMLQIAPYSSKHSVFLKCNYDRHLNAKKFFLTVS